jgi:tetratricopeptide (TPR) repeat protein
MSKLALNLICKDEEKNIARVLQSVIPNVDACYILDTGSTDKTVEIARSMGATVFESTEFNYTVTKEDEEWVKKYLGPLSKLKEGDKLFRFAQARNYLLNNTPKEYDWVLWLDSDDIFQGKENLAKIIQTAEENQLSSIFFEYWYQCEFNPDGSVKNVLIKHLRERIFRNDGTYTWKGEIHETLIPDKQVKNADMQEAVVIHTITNEDITASIPRNIKNLEFEVRATEASDPRPIYYLAKAYFDLGTDEYRKEAERLIKEGYLKGSGWGEERAQAWDYVAWVRRHFGDANNTIKAAHNSLIENPLFPDTYLTIAEGCIMKNQYEYALHWAKMASNIPIPKTTLIVNPLETAIRLYNILYVACMNLGQFEEAWAAATKLWEISPTRQGVKEVWDQANNIKQQRELTTHAGALIHFYGENKDTGSVQRTAFSLPPVISNNPVIQEMLKKYLPPRLHGNKEVTIYCGPGFEVWNPKTIEETGSGGSEEAVYRLSKELVKQGYKVSVYAEPGDQRGEYDGVNYLHHYEINWNDQFNIFIAWRNPGLADSELKTNKFYVWMHDIPQIKDYPIARVENIDKVIVLSEYQGSLVDQRVIEGRSFGIPREKLLVSKNGVTI